MKNAKSEKIKYLGSALAIGGTIMLGGGIMSEHSTLKKKAKKTAARAIDTIDTLVTGMQHFMN